MQAVILAGGLGTRISEETINKPKPLIEIGYKPILWHIMKAYSNHGVNNFLICVGYKGELIKEYFGNYLDNTSDIEIDLKSNEIKYLNKHNDNWKIKIIDTGQETNTGGRIKKVEKYLDEDFFLTYGDGVSSVNISETLNFHLKHKKISTMTIVRQPGRFGSVKISNNNDVEQFLEKPFGDEGWINGGFFVFNKRILDYLDDNSVLEKKPLETLAKIGELKSFKHNGFWYSLDSLRDKFVLEDYFKKHGKFY